MENGSSPPGQKRQRAKQACEPCRLRKRKCDGSLPCNMCAQFEYKCYFEKHPRKRSKIVEQNAVSDSPDHSLAEPPKENKPTIEEANKMRLMEANSGIAFTRLLGLRLDPSSGPKLFTFGWNLGTINDVTERFFLLPIPPITELLTRDQCFTLADLYFANVHPLYGFMNKELVLREMRKKWSHQDTCIIPDHIFAGIAALGSLFTPHDSPINDAVPRVVEAQKLLLESKSTMQPCSIMDVQSWLLRCLYLRGTEHPHAVHTSSSIMMHLAEAIGLHQEVKSATMHTSVADQTDELETRRRTFWVARLLNTWVSLEYGRTRVMLRGITTELPTPKEGDYTTNYIELYSISCCLDPEVSDRAGQWENFLRRLETFEPQHDGIALSKANLSMCGYRRLRLANPNISTESINRIIRMGLTGLEAARKMAEKGHAWWHCANVPFQVVCVFLAMDVRESLSHVEVAVRTLQFVVDRFQTATMKEALKTARFLVRLSKKRKDEDSVVLEMSLRKVGDCVDEGDPNPDNLQQPHASTNGAQLDHGNDSTPFTATSSDDWNLEAFDDANFDWNSFLAVDVPAFSDFAAQGML